MVTWSNEMKKYTRRNFLQISATTAALLAPAAVMGAALNVPSTPKAIKKLKITKVEVTYLKKPLKNRYWTATKSIGGFDPHAKRVIVKVHTDGGVYGTGEGRDSGVLALSRRSPHR